MSDHSNQVATAGEPGVMTDLEKKQLDQVVKQQTKESKDRLQSQQKFEIDRGLNKNESIKNRTAHKVSHTGSGHGQTHAK